MYKIFKHLKVWQNDMSINYRQQETFQVFIFFRIFITKLKIKLPTLAYCIGFQKNKML